MRPPQPAIPGSGTSPALGLPGSRGSGIADHVEHPGRAADRDRSRFDRSNLRALQFAVEARKADDTDDEIVARAQKFRAFLISTGTQ